MFRRVEGAADAAVVNLEFEGDPIMARIGDSVAAALLLAGIGQFRTSAVTGAPRAPYCMMGVCFDCLVEIDGVANRQACMIPAAEGMKIRRQHGARRLA